MINFIQNIPRATFEFVRNTSNVSVSVNPNVGLGSQYTTAPPANAFSLGVNISGIEISFPAVPSAVEMAWWKARGVNSIRLPFRWSTLQTTVFSAFDTTYLGYIQTAVANAASVGMTVLLDCHTSGGGPGGDIGSVAVSITAFVDMWTRLSAVFKDNPAIHGYDLMNEWALADQTIPFQANQAVITALRALGDNTTLYIEGNNYSGAWNWTTANDNFWQLLDPANNLIFSAHCYFDRDSSGTHFGAATEQADPGEAPPGLAVNVNIGVQRTSVFVNWCKLHGVRGHIGEFGISNDIPSAGGTNNYAFWNTVGDNFLAYCQANNIECHAWGAGPDFGGYPFNGEPVNLTTGSFDFSGAGFQGPQIAIFEKYTGYAGAQPTVYRLLSPQDGSFKAIVRGSVGVASGNFTLQYNGVITSPMTFTPVATYMDGTSAGGTFTPSTVTLAAGMNGIATFTYTPANSGTIQIGATNNAGLTNPPLLSYTTASDSFVALSASAVNVFATRRLFAPYIGPAIRLQRATDNAQMDFYFNNRGDLPRQAIQTWASSRVVPIVKIYDQGPLGNHETYTSGNYPLLTLVNTAGYPEITWPNGSHMDFNSQNAGLTGQAILARINDSTGSGSASYFVRQDEYTGPFSFGPYQYGVNSSPAAGVTMGNYVGAWHHYAGTFKSNTTNGIVGYLDGSQVAAANTVAYSFAQAGPGTQMGYFRFYAPAGWAGSWQNLVILNDTITSAQVAAFSSSDVTYYSVALPDSLSAVNPTISGAGAQSVFPSQFILPFNGVTIGDGNSGSPTDSVTLTLSDTNGALAGTGLSGSSPNYTIASASPASITTTLKALQFTTTSGIGSTCTITIGVTSSAGTSASDSSTVITEVALPAETPYAAPSGTFTPVNYKGVNISGGELNPSSTRPYAYDYIYPQPQEMDYFTSKGMGLMRMPMTSRRIYPTAYGALDTTQLGYIKGVIDYAFTKNLRILLDPHDYGGVWDSRTQTNRIIGSDTEGTKLFVDMWTRLATRFKNYPNVVFGLMNEPHLQTSTQWYGAATSAISAIRAAGANQLITIPGISYTGAESWVSSGNAATWAGFNGDPANNFVFEMHEYLDSDNSGTHAACVIGKGSTCLSVATSWARTNGFKVILGECGWSPATVGGTATNCPPEGTAIMGYMSSNSDVWLGWTYWLGGSSSYYKGYNYYVGPQSYTPPITDAPQMATLVANL